MDTVKLPTNFVALGFSTDTKKGKDLVLVCKFPAQLNPQVYTGYARVQLTWYTFVLMLQEYYENLFLYAL